MDILFYDFSQDGFLDGRTDMFLIDGSLAHHHDELEWKSCEETPRMIIEEIF